MTKEEVRKRMRVVCDGQLRPAGLLRGGIRQPWQECSVSAFGFRISVLRNSDLVILWSFVIRNESFPLHPGARAKN